mgnify:FL=1|tara:strand:+ start:466 stop:756 length:291 start_codon:yes stop_codon:yes gene_type:complete
MSPYNKKKLNKLRKSLDIIDKQLLNIFKKRTEIVKEVIKTKEFKKDIIDKKRINIILKKIRKESIKRKIDPKITNRIWKNIIWSYIEFEYRNFRKK